MGTRTFVLAGVVCLLAVATAGAAAGPHGGGGGWSNDTFTISDGLARFSFGRASGALCGIRNLQTGTELVSPGKPQPLFSLDLKPRQPTPEKDWVSVSSLEAKCLVAGRPGVWSANSRRFVYEINRPDGTVTIRLECRQTGLGELTWTAAVVNHLRDHEIANLTYPIVDELKADPDPARNTLLINGNYLVKKPAAFGRFLYFWPLEAAPILDLFSEREGLALVVRDRTQRSTGLSAAGGRPGDSVKLSLVKIVRIKPGETFEGAPHLVRVHLGDWHATALAERPWLAANCPVVESPLWLQECDGWYPVGWPIGWWSELDVFARQAQEWNGCGYLQVWNFQVPGTVWTIPHPNPINGTEADLRWGIDQVHRAGSRSTFYIQGAGYDPQGDGRSPDDPIGDLHRRDLWPGWELPGTGFTDACSIRDPAGKTTQWSAHERVLCYASGEFQEFKRHWAIDLFMKRLGVDGIYWDSLVLGHTCWATNHGHGDDPGQWGIGAAANHRLIRQQAKPLNPDAVFAMEGCSDTLGQSTDINLDLSPNMEVVRFLTPRKITFLGNSDGSDPTWRKAFLDGCRFDGRDRRDNSPEKTAMFQVRRAVKQYLYPATFMDTVGVRVQGSDTVQARLFLCAPDRTKGAVITLINDDKVRGATVTVDATAFGPVRHAWVVDAAGKNEPLRGGESIDGGRAYRLPVPAVFASTVLLFNRAEPRVTVGPVAPIAREGQTQVPVLIESLTGERLQGTVGLAAPGFTATTAHFDVSGYKDAGQKLTLTLTANPSARLGLADVPVEIAVAGGPRFRKVATVYVEEPVRVTPAWVGPEKLRVTIANRSTRSQMGAVRLAMADGEVRFAGAPPSWPYRLAPGTARVFTANLAGGFHAQVPWSITGQVTCGNRSWPLYRPFRPAILNGSMERRRFRPEIPDYWWGTFDGRTPEMCGKGKFQFDDTVAADGKWSLKIVGQPKEWQAACLECQLRPATRYRFHVQIRRTAHSPNIYAGILETRVLPDGKSEPVMHAAGQIRTGPLDQWQTFETTFTSLPVAQQAVVSRLYLYNPNTTATVWFDDIRLVPEEE